MIQQQQQKTSQWVLTSVQFNLVFKYFSSFLGLSRLEIDSPGSGPGDSGHIGVRGEVEYMVR